MACEQQWAEYNSAVMAAQMADLALTAANANRAMAEQNFQSALTNYQTAQALKQAKTQLLINCLQAP